MVSDEDIIMGSHTSSLGQRKIMKMRKHLELNDSENTTCQYMFNATDNKSRGKFMDINECSREKKTPADQNINHIDIDFKKLENTTC